MQVYSFNYKQKKNLRGKFGPPINEDLEKKCT